MTYVSIGWIDGGTTRGEFSESVAILAAYEAQRGRLANVLRVQSGPLVEEGRNLLVERFLATESDWLFMVDTDMTFRWDAVEQLLHTAGFVDGLVVGGLAFGANQTIGVFPTIYRELDGMPAAVMDIPDGIVEVEATGSAFTLTHRSVFLDHKRDEYHPWFHRRFVPSNGTHPGGWLGEDISWCFWLRQRGVKIYVDPRIEAGHVKATNLCRATYQPNSEFWGKAEA